MASIFQQAANAVGLGSSTSGASAVSPSSNSTGTALSLQLSNNALVSGSEQVFVAGPNGATIDASSSSSPVVIVGGSGTDHLIGGSAPDLIIGGSGTNVMTGGGGADIFGHMAGATDTITDFSPSSGEEIALAHGLTYSSSHTVTINPASLGLSGSPAASNVLTFSDGSTVTLLGNTEAPSTSWFI